MQATVSSVTNQPHRDLWEQACLRWRRRGVSSGVAPAPLASQLPQGWRGLCWSWLACDGVDGVSAAVWRLHRWQANSHRDGAGFVGAGLPAMASAGCQQLRGACIVGKPTPTGMARALLELACLRWRRRGVSNCVAPASLASQLPQGWRGLCWSWLACDGVGGVSAAVDRVPRSGVTEPTEGALLAREVGHRGSWLTLSLRRPNTHQRNHDDQAHYRIDRVG